MILEERVQKLHLRLRHVFPFWKQLNTARQDVLINMGYNLGISKLLKFKKMIHALEEKKYKKSS